MVVYLTADQIAALHRRAIEAYGGLDGVRSEQQFLSAVFQPQQTVFGEDAYPTIPEKAAAYGFFLAENQPFIDGNKRTAAAVMATFLALNGFDLVEQSETELAEVFERLGSRRIGQGEFFEWVANHVQPLDTGGTDSELQS